MNAAVPWTQVLAVAGGAAVGALLRWRAGLWLNSAWAGFPLGTLLVNAVGGLMVGAALAWFEQSPNETLRLLLVTGFLGGLTTFSAFSAESLLMLNRGQFGLAAGHTLAHVLGALLCAALAHRMATALLG
jgi:CrcB protein